MRQTAKVTFEIDPAAPRSRLFQDDNSIIDAGPDCAVSFKGGILELQGPMVNYKVHDVRRFSVEICEI